MVHSSRRDTLKTRYQKYRARRDSRYPWPKRKRTFMQAACFRQSSFLQRLRSYQPRVLHESCDEDTEVLTKIETLLRTLNDCIQSTLTSCNDIKTTAEIRDIVESFDELDTEGLTNEAIYDKAAFILSRKEAAKKSLPGCKKHLR